jgi:ribosomal protein L11 methyltransferase
VAVYSVRLEADAAEEDSLAAEFAGYGTVGVVVDSGPSGRVVLEAWFEGAEAASDCAAGLARFEPAIREARVENWNAAWQGGWMPVEVGRRWFLTPPDFAGEVPAGRDRLDMHPGTLFGNGDHPTTLLCLAAMEDCVTAGSSFLDLGCGSGLLMAAAARLGARVVVGCDLDLRAAGAASMQGTGAFAGSIEAIRPGSMDVIVANIQLGVLQTLLPSITVALSPRGVVLLSGVLSSQREDLLEAVAKANLSPLSIQTKEEWLLASASSRGLLRGSEPSELS